jgi:hypothetical protein
MRSRVGEEKTGVCRSRPPPHPGEGPFTDAEGRNHSSFTREYVALPGRDFRPALRVDF